MLQRLRHDQRGILSSEWAALLALAGAVVAAIVWLGVPQALATEIRVALCRIAGEQCAGDSPFAPHAPCVVAASSRKVSGSVTIVVFKLGGGVEGIYETRADGTVAVTLRASGEAGLEFRTPAPSAAAGGTGGGASGKFSVTGQGELSRKWVFDSTAAADAFIHRTVERAIAKSDPIPNFLQSADDYELPAHAETTVQGGIGLAGSASAGSGGAYAGVTGNLSGAVGARFHANGDVTYFVKAAGGVAGEAGVFMAGGASATARGDVTIGITYDARGNEKAMTVIGTAQGTGGLQLADAQDLRGLMRAVQKAGARGSAEQGGRIEYQAELDLTDPANRRAARAFLDGADPLTGEPVARHTAFGYLFERFEAGATIDYRTYETDHSKLGADVSLGPLGGFQASFDSTDHRLTSAYYREPGVGWVPWTACTEAA